MTLETIKLIYGIFTPMRIWFYLLCNCWRIKYLIGELVRFYYVNITMSQSIDHKDFLPESFLDLKNPQKDFPRLDPATIG